MKASFKQGTLEFPINLHEKEIDSIAFLILKKLHFRSDE